MGILLPHLLLLVERLTSRSHHLVFVPPVVSTSPIGHEGTILGYRPLE